MDDNKRDEMLCEVSKIIFTYCMARTPNREEAEDLSQDILCELIKSVPSIRDENAFYGFMWALAGNVYKQWCRKRARRQECELTEDIPAEEDIMLEEEDSELFLLRRELSLLSEKYRLAAILYYFEAKSCQEIAQTLSISESMVKYLLFRSRKILKEGMSMERKLGTLSYNPKSLISMYSGSGPNCFWEFMQSKIRQNIVGACYNDSLTPQQISLETGVPLPYLDDEIKALEEKWILKKEGPRYKTNVIVITADCSDEIERDAVRHQDAIASAIHAFLNRTLPAYREIGFSGADFSDNTLRWQLAVLVFREITFGEFGEKTPEQPTTAWGDSAWIYCMEKKEEMEQIFAYSGISSKYQDSLLFFDYCPKLKGDHHDFFGKEHETNLICDIAHGEWEHFSEYDLEVVAEMVKKGYVLKHDSGYQVAVPVYTVEQYEKAMELVSDFIQNELKDMIQELDRSAARILGEHTPKHLQDQVLGIALRNKFTNAVSKPAKIMVEKGYLNTEWNPGEMPTTYMVLKQ